MSDVRWDTHYTSHQDRINRIRRKLREAERMLDETQNLKIVGMLVDRIETLREVIADLEAGD